MPLVSCKQIVLDAQRGGYAIAAINSNGGNYDILRACLETAEECRAPFISQVYVRNGKYAGLGYIAHSATYLIQQFAPSVPVALHLDHGQEFADCVEAVRAGFTSVMCDGSKLPLEENIALTRKVVEMARAVGVTVEAEVGQLLSGETDPNSPAIVQVDDVRRFTAAAAVDMLAVAIGNSHGYYKGVPIINTQRLKEVRAVTDVPLVLHGCTGMAEATVKECIGLGMAKINFGTMLRNNYLKYFDEAYHNTDHQGHPWRCMQYAKDKLKDDVRWILSLTGSEGKAS
jgi:ketose-bisphosphate aldolase